MPVTELSFPAITVCRQGLDMAAVQRAMELDYEDWVARQGASRRKRSVGSGDSMDTYLREMWVVLLLCLTVAIPRQKYMAARKWFCSLKINY